MRQAGVSRSTFDSSENAVLRGASLRELQPPVGGASPALRAALLQERVVRVSALGDRLLLPIDVLSAGLSDLRLATGECASLEDYAEGVGIVLRALEVQGKLVFSG